MGEGHFLNPYDMFPSQCASLSNQVRRQTREGVPRLADLQGFWQYGRFRLNTKFRPRTVFDKNILGFAENFKAARMAWGGGEVTALEHSGSKK